MIIKKRNLNVQIRLVDGKAEMELRIFVGGDYPTITRTVFSDQEAEAYVALATRELLKNWSNPRNMWPV
jgi:hypothetical protein